MVAFLAVGVAVARGAAAPAEEMRSAMQALRADVQAFAALRDELAAGLPVPAGAATDNGCLQLRLAGALDDKALLAEAIRREGAFTEGRSTTSPGPSVVADLDASDLKLAGNALSGTLAFTITPYGDKRRLADDLGIPFVARYTIEGKLQGLAVKGAAKLANPREAPLSDARLVLEGRFVPLVRVVFAPVGDAELTDSYLSDIGWLESAANRVYEQIRAMAFQQAAGLPVALATNAVLAYRVDRGQGSQATSSRKRAQQERLAKSAKPSLDEAGDALLEETRPVPPAVKATTEDPAQVLAAAREARERLAAMAAAVRRHRAAPRPLPAQLQVGDVDPGDPEFGPWFGAEPLPLDKDQRQRFPPPATDGRPRWPFVGKWRMSGPFPHALWEFALDELPDLFPALSTKTVVQTDRLAGGGWFSYHGNGKSPWELVSVDTRGGRALAPIYSKFKYPRYGMPWSHIFGVTEVVADRDVEMWAAMEVNDRGQLWVNERPVWTSGPNDHRQEYAWRRFKLPLRAGVNRLMVRWTDDLPPEFFTLRVCVSGAPRAPEAARAGVEARRAFYASSPHPMKGTQGFMNDQTGHFPDAKPALAWNTKTGANVAWHLPLKAAHASPVMTRDLIVTVEEPYYLIAVRKDTGAVAWRREVDPLTALKPDELPKVAPLKERLAKVESEAADLERSRAAADKLAEKRKEVQAAVGALGHAYRCIGMSFERSSAYGGHFFATPITDGTNVWVKLNRHVVACYDLEGSLKWMRPLGNTGGGFHGMSSPVLLGGRLICEICEDDRAPEDAKPASDEEDDDAFDANRRPYRHELLVAFDARTGQPAWRSPRYANPRIGNRYNAEGVVTPAVARLTDGSRAVDVLITAGGAVIRAEDGVMPLRYLGFMSDFALPVVREDRTHFWTQWSSSHGGQYGELAAVQLLMHDRDWIGARFLGSVAADLAQYAMANVGERVFMYTGDEANLLDPLGRRVAGRVHDLYACQPGEAYVWPTVAGGHVFIGERGGWGMLQRDPRRFPGSMPVLRIEPDLHVVARNPLQGMIGAPVFERGRMYARTDDGLTCIGVQGEDGARYEARELARTVMTAWPARKPDDAPPVEPKAVAETGTVAGWPLRFGAMSTAWWQIGPVPLARVDEARRAIGIPEGLAPPGGGKLSLPGGETIPAQHYARFFDSPNEGSPGIREWPYGPELDLNRAAKDAANVAVYWHVSVVSPRECTVRFDLKAPPGVTAWMGGLEARDGQRLRLRRGSYPLFIEGRIEPPAAAGRVSVRFHESEDPAAELAAWRRRIEGDRDILEKAVALLPGTDLARRAAEALKW